MHDLLLAGTELVATSEIARVEFASAAHAAARAGRVPYLTALLAQFDLDTQPQQRIHLVALRPDVVLPAAYRLVMEYRLRTLDAIHLAVALEEGPGLAGDLDLVFVTRDTDQAEAAKTLGLNVR